MERQNKRIIFLEYFSKAPLLGTGFSFNPDFAKRTTELFLRIAVLQETDIWADVRSFIELKQPHEGDIFALQTSGIIGTAFFVLFCLASLWYACSSVLVLNPRDLAPVQIWSLALLFQQSAAFFTVYGDYSTTLTVMCPVIAILAASEKVRPESQLAFVHNRGLSAVRS